MQRELFSSCRTGDNLCYNEPDRRHVHRTGLRKYVGLTAFPHPALELAWLVPSRRSFEPVHRRKL